jgi:flagellar basal body P-ring protein FlgI
MTPRRPTIAFAVFLLAASQSACTSLFDLPESWRSQSPEEPAVEEAARTQLIGDIAVAYGRGQISVEGVGLVVGLKGTGSDPAPSIYKNKMLEEMRKDRVDNEENLLASPNTALVVVRGFLRPGLAKGDPIDVEVRAVDPDTTSLEGGYLMPARLSENIVAGGAIREGRPAAMARGHVMISGSGEGEAGAAATRGRILGGGVCLQPQSLGLLLRPEHEDVRNSARIGYAVNKRFHAYVNGVKEDLATPRTDQVIDLKIHAKYKENVPRFLNVVRAMPLKETPAQQMQRLELLERQLLDPLTASTAALRLEAVGTPAVDVLIKGTQSADPEVRFYSAEALAYLDHEKSGQAAAALAEAARGEPAFRVFALTALSAINQYEAADELRKLMSVKSAETRYGAFRALWAMDKNDAFVQGEMLADQFSLHLLNVEGPPMVHVTRSFRPEIVIFGHQQELQTPFILDVGEIHLKAPAGGPVEISRFGVGLPDQKRTTSPRLAEVIRAMVELDASYPDVVAVLQQAAQKKLLAPDSRLAFDALPQAGRNLTRDGESAGDGEESRFTVRNPLPNLFPDFTKAWGADDSVDAPPPSPEEESTWSDSLGLFWPGNWWE